MADQPMDYQPQPSVLQVAQDVHKPTAAAPGPPFPARLCPNQRVFYTCLAPYCETSFQRTEDLDDHYKLHDLPFEVLGADTNLSTSGKPSQQLLCAPLDANFVRNGFNALIHGPFVGSEDYSAHSVNQNNDGLLNHNSIVRDAYTMSPNAPSLSIANDVFVTNKLQTPVVGGDQLKSPSSTPLEVASATTRSISPPPPQTPATETPPPPRHVCATCGKPFKRAPDMQRHAKKHDPGAQRFDCPAAGCRYKGGHGFLRRDKMMKHCRDRHPGVLEA